LPKTPEGALLHPHLSMSLKPEYLIKLSEIYQDKM